MPHIQTALEGSYPSVRIAALETLKILIPEGISEVMLTIQPILQDSYSNVREAALETLLVLLERDKASVSEIFPSVQAAFEDHSWRVRISAVRALPALLEKGVAVSEVLLPMQTALLDNAWQVRKAAFEVLPKMIAKGTDLIGIVPYIQIGLRDSLWNVRVTATKVLDKVPTASLIDIYWQKRTEDGTPCLSLLGIKRDADDIVALLVPRLYEIVLTLEKAKLPQRCKLVLRDAQGDLVQEWEKPRRELERLRRVIKRTPPYFKQWESRSKSRLQLG
ncbi:MAG: hypothetical protein AAF706_03430 [Bacteroidota bacterium]